MPASAATFRKLAVSLPNTFENAHMGHPDFRIATPDGKGRIFATLSGEEKGRGVLMLTPEQQTAFCAELPTVFEPVQGGWGRTGSTYLHLSAVEEDVLLGALTTAHRNAVAKLESVKPKSTTARRSATAKPQQSPASARPKIKK